MKAITFAFGYRWNTTQTYNVFGGASNESRVLLRVQRRRLSSTDKAHMNCQSCYRIALFDRAGFTTLHRSVENWGHSLMHRYSDQGEQVATISLAGFLSVEKIAVVNFAKFNCEGAEFPILMAAPMRTLRRLRRMSILYHLDLAKGYTIDALINRLVEAGFAYRHFNPYNEASRGWIDATLQEVGVRPTQP